MCLNSCPCGSSRFDSTDPYQMLDMFHTEIQEHEQVMASLLESAGLFEVTVSDFKQLKQCRYSLQLRSRPQGTEWYQQR